MKSLSIKLMKKSKYFLVLFIFFVIIKPVNAQSVTYNAGLDTITIIGFTEKSPCNFTYIYQQDLLNNWNQISLQNVNQFFLETNLEIGNGVNITWFADTEKEICFANQKELTIKDRGSFRLGLLENESKFTTSNGCIVIMNLTTVSKRVKVDGSIELYSSVFLNSRKTGGMFYLSPSVNSSIRLWNSRVSEFGYIYQYGQWNISENNWYRCNIENNDYGLSLTTGNFPKNHFFDTYITNCDYGVRNTWLGYLGDENITFRNAVIIDSRLADFDFYRWGSAGNTADFYFIDGVCDWSFYWSACNDALSRFYRQYSFNLEVVDIQGNPIENATVLIYDKKDNLVVNENTWSNGSIKEQVLTYGYYHPSGGNIINISSPHKIIIFKKGYLNNTFEWNITEPVIWVESLVSKDQGISTIIWLQTLIWIGLLIIGFLKENKILIMFTGFFGIILSLFLMTETMMGSVALICLNLYLLYEGTG